MADLNTGPEVPPLEVRGSNVHGRGVFATRRIEKGERIVEYLGERVSHEEADRRYELKEENDSHTFLFIVDSKTVIDAGNEGNDARFFNHSCDPNCESTVEKRRVFIDALRTIEPGQEMTYDYQIYRDHDDPENIDEIFACRCGFAQCRGTMLWPPEEPKKKRKAVAKKKKSAPLKGKKSGAGKAKTSAAAKKSGAGKKKSAQGKTGKGKKKSAGGKGSAAAQKSAAAKKGAVGKSKRGKSSGKVAKKKARRR